MSDQGRKSGFTSFEIQLTMVHEIVKRTQAAGTRRVHPKATLEDLDRTLGEHWTLRGIAPYAAVFGRWSRE